MRACKCRGMTLTKRERETPNESLLNHFHCPLKLEFFFFLYRAASSYHRSRCCSWMATAIQTVLTVSASSFICEGQGGLIKVCLTLLLLLMMMMMVRPVWSTSLFSLVDSFLMSCLLHWSLNRKKKQARDFSWMRFILFTSCKGRERERWGRDGILPSSMRSHPCRRLIFAGRCSSVASRLVGFLTIFRAGYSEFDWTLVLCAYAKHGALWKWKRCVFPCSILTVRHKSTGNQCKSPALAIKIIK